MQELWFAETRKTPERVHVYNAMVAMDEGLGSRAYRCLLQLADGDALKPDDVEWLTDGVEPSPIARMGDRGCELTALGKLLADAANRGDVQMMLGLTTLPGLLSDTIAGDQSRLP